MYISIYLIQCTRKISIYDWYIIYFLFFGELRLQCPDFRFWPNFVFQNGLRSNRKPVTLPFCGSVQCHALHGCCTSPNTVCPRRSFRFQARPWSTAVVGATVCGPCGCWPARRSNGSIRTRSRGRIWRRSRIISRRRRRWRSRWSGQTQQPSLASCTRARQTRSSAANRLSPTMTRWSAISSACWGTVCATSATTVVTCCAVQRRCESNTRTQTLPSSPPPTLRVNQARWAMLKLFDKTNRFFITCCIFSRYFLSRYRDLKLYNHLPGHAHKKLVKTDRNGNYNITTKYYNY